MPVEPFAVSVNGDLREMDSTDFTMSKHKWFGRWVQVRHVPLRHGAVRFGKAGEAWTDRVGCVELSLGMAGMAGSGRSG